MFKKKTEVLAGISSFFSISYLLSLYPHILHSGGLDLFSAFQATVFTTFLATCFLAIWADFPALLAPSLSVGPYLVHFIILGQKASWPIALGIVFWVGIIIYLLTIFRVRQKILSSLPPSVKIATTSGIGLFLFLLGLQNSGILEKTSLAPYVLGSLVVFFLFYLRKNRGAFFFTFVFSLALHYLNGESSLAKPSLFLGGIDTAYPKLDLLGALDRKWWDAILSVTLICLFDTSASIAALTKIAGRVDKKGEVLDADSLLIPDGLSSSLGSFFGAGTLTFAFESSAGIQVGGRSKIAALSAAFCILGSFFLYPYFIRMPFSVTAPLLMATGMLMMGQIRRIEWKELSSSLSCLFVLAMIPFTMSVYLSFALGFSFFVVLEILRGRGKKLSPIVWALAALFLFHFSAKVLF